MKLVYPPLYVRQLGLGASYAGILSGTAPFIRGVGAPLLGYLADKTNTRKLVFLVSLAAHAVTPILLLIPRPGKQLFNFKREHESSRGFSTNLNTFEISSDQASYLKMMHQKGNQTQQIHSALEPSEQFLRRNSDIHADEFNGNNHRMTSEMQTIFLILMSFSAIGEFVSAPARNLADSALLETLGSESSRCGEYRLWGNVGQIILYSINTVTAKYIHMQPSCDLSVQDDYEMSMYAISFFLVIAHVCTLQINFNRDCYSERKVSITLKEKEASLKGNFLDFRNGP